MADNKTLAPHFDQKNEVQKKTVDLFVSEANDARLF